MKKGDNSDGFEAMSSGISSAISHHNKFLTNMAYEMRTALNAITGFSEILESEEIADELQEYASEINSASKGLTNLVNDVIEFTKLDLEADSQAKGSCQLNNMLDEVESITRYKAEKKGLTFEISVSDGVGEVITCNQRYLRSCLTRLADQTVKFAKEGSVKIQVSLKQNGHICFDFFGGGIKLDDRSRADLFQPFSQNCDDIYRDISDTGLGFAIVARTADVIGASLTVSNEPNSEKIFTMSLPVEAETTIQNNGDELNRSKLVDDYLKQHDSDSSDGPRVIDGKPRVLVAEDNLANQTVIKILLKRKGFDVTAVSDGVEAVARTMDSEFDIILMDMRMPKMNGIDAIKQIRQQGVKIPIIALTALDEAEVSAQDGSSLIDGYIPKPIDANTLSVEISKFIVLPEKVNG